MRPEVERWFLQSGEELSAADVSFQGKKWFAVAFWCHQSVEKALKALFMVQKKESPGTTHSLTFLGREVGVPARYRSFLRELTKEYYLSRYPDASEDVPSDLYNKEDAQNYLLKSKELLQWVELQLRK